MDYRTENFGCVAGAVAIGLYHKSIIEICYFFQEGFSHEIRAEASIVSGKQD